MKIHTTPDCSIDPETESFIAEFQTALPERTPALLDLRNSVSFQALHIHGATNFNGINDKDGILVRLNELPAPSSNIKLAILGSDDETTTNVILELRKKGYDVLLVQLETLLRHLPTETGPKSRILWSPAPILQENIPHIVTNLELEERTAIDIGAGSGRDSAYLASHGFRVTAIDRDTKLLEKARRLGSLHASQGGSVLTIHRTFGAHLQEDQAFLHQHACKLLVVVRFLRRGVLELLHHAVLPNGFVVYEHFLRGCEAFGGPVKASQMLEIGELERVFSVERGFSVLQSEQQRLQDGRPIIRFVAKRDRT